MKRFGTLCALLVVAGLLLATTSVAQNIKVKRIGRSLNSMTAPVKGAPAPTWNISTGLSAVGVQAKSWFKVDTVGSGAVGTPSWTLAKKPATSTAVLDSGAGAWYNSVKPDLVGEYVVSATVGAQTAYDTIYASTYAGTGTDAQAGCFCHPTAAAIKTTWQKSVHGSMFTRGITGYQEIERGKGAYAAGCIKCHTTGWDPTANNNNFGYKVKQSGWDTTWYKGLEFLNGDYWITTGDSSKYNLLTAGEKTLGDIGCEQCHGPANDHKTMGPTKKNIGLAKYDNGICQQCHDGSRRHSLGTFEELSHHEIIHLGVAAEGGRANCQPCHTGAGMMYYLNNNMDTTGIGAAWNLSRDASTPITCQVCHDPHGNDNPAALRTMKIKGDTLRNGYKVPAALATNAGMLCGTCHNARYSVKARVTTTAPYYGFVNRYGPHYNNQLDMLVGSNGYQYGDTTFTGLTTHASLEGMCVKCHMQDRKNRLDGGGNMLKNHSFSMSDTTFATGVYKPSDVCGECHGEIEDFDDIKAFYDYDRNGRIEGTMTEVKGMLAVLKTKLPIDPATGEPTTALKDSLLVKNHPEYVQGIWNYYFVKNDRSYGVHNTKYAVRLLYKALGWTPLSVKNASAEVPTEFALDQNYPNPFNPSTVIRFSLPTESPVKLEVYDMTGGLVKTLVNEGVRAGSMEVTWDGTNAGGTKVASGMYLYRLQAGNFVSAKKMLLLK